MRHGPGRIDHNLRFRHQRHPTKPIRLLRALGQHYQHDHPLQTPDAVEHQLSTHRIGTSGYGLDNHQYFTVRSERYLSLYGLFVHVFLRHTAAYVFGSLFPNDRLSYRVDLYDCNCIVRSVRSGV